MKLRNKKTGEIVDHIWWDSEIEQLCINGEHMKFYNSLAELNEEWTDYEEPKKYWYINEFGTLAEITHTRENIYDKQRKNFGNYFDTKEEAQEAVEKLKAFKRLKDKKFQFHGYDALGCGEITFSLDFEDMDDEGEIGQLRHDLDLLFSGEDD